MNAQSSRSHAIFTVTIERSDLGADKQQHVRVGKLHLVDLAVREERRGEERRGEERRGEERRGEERRGGEGRGGEGRGGEGRGGEGRGGEGRGGEKIVIHEIRALLIN